MRKLSYFVSLLALLSVVTVVGAADIPATVEAEAVEAAPAGPGENICPADIEALTDPIGKAEEATHYGSCPWTPNLFCDCIPGSSRQNCINCCNNAYETCFDNCTHPMALCVYECEQNASECVNQCYIHWA